MEQVDTLNSCMKGRLISNNSKSSIKSSIKFGMFSLMKYHFKRGYKNDILKNRNCCILIGPEGDFTKEEIEISKQYSFHPISLGNSRLRTETAGIAGCHLLNIINNL